ncbi:MAG: flagellar hook-length control protein FliK [Planctomycetaceae bacterium]
MSEPLPSKPTEVTVPHQTATSQDTVSNDQPPEIPGPDISESQRLLSGRESRAKANPVAINRPVATAAAAKAAVPMASLAVEASTGNNVAVSSDSRPAVTASVSDATRGVPVAAAAAGVAAGVDVQTEGTPATDELRQPAGAITSGTSTAGTAKAAGSPMQQIPDSRQLEFVNRVADAMRGAPTSGNQIRVRLTPPELGTLQIEVSLRDGVMTAKMETETASAQRMIMDHLPHLKEALTQNGTLVDRFVVEQSDERGKQHATGGDQDSERESNTDDRSRDQGRRDDRSQTDQAEAGEPDGKEIDLRLSSIDELDIQI